MLEKKAIERKALFPRSYLVHIRLMIQWCSVNETTQTQKEITNASFGELFKLLNEQKCSKEQFKSQRRYNTLPDAKRTAVVVGNHYILQF